MLKNLVTLEQKIEDRVYELQCHGPATWGEIHDVLWKMRDYVVEQINRNHEQEVKEKSPEVEIKSE